MLLTRLLLPRCSRRTLHSSALALAGHSKWAKIARDKGVNDAARAAVFAKASAAISAAARAGGPDPEHNLRLAAALDRARAAATPKAVIERALAAGAGAGSAAGEEVLFEILGPCRVAVLVSALTDNKARTTLGLRTIVKRHSAALQPGGSLAFMFEARGRLEVALRQPPAAGGDALDALLEVATDAEALDVEAQAPDADTAVVWTTAPRIWVVAKALETAGWRVESRETTRRATVTVGVPADDEKSVQDLLQALEDHEGVVTIREALDRDAFCLAWEVTVRLPADVADLGRFRQRAGVERAVLPHVPDRHGERLAGLADGGEAEGVALGEEVVDFFVGQFDAHGSVSFVSFSAG